MVGRNREGFDALVGSDEQAAVVLPVVIGWTVLGA
jgi:hypothetical protein